MAKKSGDARPRRFPPPEFPPRKAAAFARTPPAIFPPILGLLGLGLAARKAASVMGWPDGLAAGLVESVLGAVLALWAFATFALLAKLARRPGVLLDDLQTLPGRAGFATMSMSAMAAAAVLAPYAPGPAYVLLIVALAVHAVLALVLIRVLVALPPEARGVNPVWHQSFVGFIVAGVGAAALGKIGLAEAVLVFTVPVALVIWGISLTQLMTRVPPAPLRPFLAIHLAPASLFVLVAQTTGHQLVAQVFTAVSVAILMALIVSARWITVAGFTPLWGAFTFPLAASAGAALTLGTGGLLPGVALLIVAIGVVPAISWGVLSLWPGGRLAAKTNAAEA